MNVMPGKYPTISRQTPLPLFGQRNPNKSNSLAAVFLMALVIGAAAMALIALTSAPACAEDGTITIHSLANKDAQYDAYELFKADVEDGTRDGAQDGSATHIKWASEKTRDIVVGFLEANDYLSWLAENGHGQENANNPQHAAEFIGQLIIASEDDSDAGSDPPAKRGTSFAISLAQALSSAGIEALAAYADEPFTAEEGLWLFVTKKESIGADESGSSAMWIPLGSSTITIDEKARTSTLGKYVRGGAENSWGEWTDAHYGQVIDYRITFALPDNIGSYAHYHWRVDDALPAGLELAEGDLSTVKVRVGDADLTSEASLRYENNTLSVEFSDLLDILSARKGDILNVEYKARFTADAVTGLDGNTNIATCTHTADPISELDVSDTPVQAIVYAWQIELTKHDKSTREALPEAKFTISKTESEESPAGNAYLQADGSLLDTPFEFESDANGKISIPHVASGNYVIHETAAPTGYELQDSDITLAISLTPDEQTGRPESLSAHITGGESADDESEIATKIESADASAGIVRIITSDDKRSTLPLTGLDGTTALYLAAAGCAAASLALYARKKRREPQAKRKAIGRWRQKCPHSTQRDG